MDTFATYKKLESQPKHIKCSSKEFVVNGVTYKLFTYTMSVPRNSTEDDMYAKNPELLDVLPRACSILTRNGTILTSLEGPKKFSGRTSIDEDPEDDEASPSGSVGIYDHTKVLSWATSGVLEIVETVKENGKFAICKLFEHEGTILIVCGSKNYHIVTTIDTIDTVIEQQQSITKSILQDIKYNYSKLITRMELFKSGYSLVGELCDGQHFTPGDNKIYWFGLFKNGTPYDPIQSLETLKDAGLNIVEYRVVFHCGDAVEGIDTVFRHARCTNGEGSVLYCKNTSTGEYILVKNKSVNYIVKRFTRQSLIRGYKELEHIRNRFVDAQSYHGLATDFAIDITHKLYKFGFWMMKKCYPVSVLGHTQVTSIRGVLDNGFSRYWQEFLSDGGDEIVVTPDSFGTFNKDMYLSKTEMYPLRDYNDPVEVVFLQGLQGSGKSTIGDYCCKKIQNSIYIEQDMYYGDTLSCQGVLYHQISNANGPKVIFITRCNINSTHYRRYLDICHKLPTIVTFFTPNRFDPLYYMISLAGVINRSKNGDKLMIGRFEVGVNDVVSFTKGNYDSYERHPKAIYYETHKNDQELLDGAKSVYKKGVSDVISFVNTNYERLMALRLPLEEVCKPFLEPLIKDNIVVSENPSYIGAAVSSEDRRVLMEFVEKHVPGQVGFTTYLHHMTQRYIGGKMPKVLDFTPFLPGETITRHICALVVRKSDKASAFRISPFPGDAPNFHITAKLPSGLKAMASNGFVGLNDNNVSVIKMDYPIDLVGFWKA
jgi:hypothetical protein